MDARAVNRFVVISPRKGKLTADLIKGKPVNEAIAILSYTPRKAAAMMIKTLRSAIANAMDKEGTGNLDADTLYVKEAVFDPGPVMPRWRPRAYGRASRIRKRMSHIRVVVTDEMPAELRGSRKARKLEALKPKKRGKRRKKK
jgi:large subunit ribosomal protein L22